MSGPWALLDCAAVCFDPWVRNVDQKRPVPVRQSCDSTFALVCIRAVTHRLHLCATLQRLSGRWARMGAASVEGGSGRGWGLHQLK
eukprot:328176-Chlamydomonas_euryale.AAC.1